MTSSPLVVEKTYNAPVERVWSAITDKDKLKQWYFDLDDFKPEVGFEFHFDGQNEGFVYHHICVVKEVVPLKKLTHSWRYKGYEGDSLVTWELFSEPGNKTRVVLTHTGLETFPASKEFARENFKMGWMEIVGRMLKEYVEK